MRLKRLAVVALLCGIPAFAGPILLNNTGMNGDPAVPITPGLIDPNWILVGGDYNASVVTGSPAGFPFPNWLPNDANSQWIAPQAAYAVGPPPTNDPEGDWIFRTTFTIEDGMDPMTASITGRWLADNQGIDIYLNSVIYTPTQSTPLNVFATTWTAFSISGGSGLFQTGLNTLEFIVQNNDAAQGGPVGLRVEMEGEVSEIPEPATIGLLGAGLLALGLIRRRRA